MTALRIRYWYVLLAVILILGGALRFTGYNYQLPYRDLVSADEVNLFVDTLIQRGLLPNAAPTAQGYPPGIFVVDGAAELLAEGLTGQSFWDAANTAMAIIRLWAALTGLITAFIIALWVRTIASDLAALLVTTIWLVLPNPNLQTVREMPMAWVLLFAALSLYLATIALTQSHPWLTIASVVAGLLAVSFRYSEVILLGPPIFVALWFVRKNSRASVILLIQIFLVLLFFVIGWIIYGNRYKTSESDHVGIGIAQLFNWSAQRPILDASITQVGLSPAVFLFFAAIGTLLYIREYGLGKRTISWSFILGYGALSAVLVEVYLYYLFRTPRYVTPASIPFTILAGVGLIKAITWLKNVVNQKWLVRGVIATTSLIWIVPMGMQSLQLDLDRLRPDTHAALITWAATNLTDGTILVDAENQYIFSKIYGGYPGAYRISIREDLTAHSSAYWHSQDVYFAAYSEGTVDNLRNTAPNAFSQLLLLNQFPPTGSKENWQNSPVFIYRLWGIQFQHNEPFVNGIAFKGYDISNQTVQHGETIQLNFYWNATQKPLDNFNVFLHLVALDNPTQIVAQSDGAPANLNRPTLSWTNPDELLISPAIQLTIPEATKPGCYRLIIGLYNYLTGQRLLLSNGLDAIQLTKVCVNASDF